MRAAHEAGGTAFDLSFSENVRLFRKLQAETAVPLLGFGNPTWEQGVMLNGQFLQYERDRILKTLVDRLWPRPIARLVEDELSQAATMVFGYDRQAQPLTDAEIAAITLDEAILRGRLDTLQDCEYMFFGGSDADWLVSLGRADLLADLARVVREAGHQPVLLCHYATLVVPAAEAMDLDTVAHAIPFNKVWTWFDLDECIKIVKSLDKPVIAFMPLASGDLKADVEDSLRWLFDDMAVESILFGTATPGHARETTRIAHSCRTAVEGRGARGTAYAAH
jgi:hypothetical protein